MFTGWDQKFTSQISVLFVFMCQSIQGKMYSFSCLPSKNYICLLTNDVAHKIKIHGWFAFPMAQLTIHIKKMGCIFPLSGT